MCPSCNNDRKEEKQKHKEKLSEVKKKAAKQNQKKSSAEQKYKVSFLLNIILVISVVGMFLISATSSHPTILNYEEEIVNRYAAWEQELSEREAALREAENR